ncbi:MAG: RNA-binding transcriptional accessory protein [Candidatus Absconditabacterales bacterium]|nr:RNA-binding transcriptional accessory protein [Candidatus Absconditabacterales bacterium]
MISLLAQKTGMPEQRVRTIVALLEEGSTIPFLARYRKEQTGGATDTQLREFERMYVYQKNLEEKKADIIRILTEKGLLTSSIELAISQATTLATLNDIYRPFKEKKHTRATKALEKGLKPLADALLACRMDIDDFDVYAQSFVRDTGDEKTSVRDIDEAIDGAIDIVAEMIADRADIRQWIKQTHRGRVILTAKPTKTFDPHGVYATYQLFKKPLFQTQSYAYLALARAEKEKQLSLSVHYPEDDIISYVESLVIPPDYGTVVDYLQDAVEDGIKRLLLPSLTNEMRSELKEEADRQAIDVFGTNVQELLLAPPVKGKIIMGVDPGIRTGNKIAIIDSTGSVLAFSVIFTTPDDDDKLAQLLIHYKVDIVSLGNGTGCREVEAMIARVIKNNNLMTKFIIVSEAGASVYSASELASQEYPDLDVTIRGAVNIGHRLQDPLSALVKIDPKSLGIGQYQHDVDQHLLHDMLDKKIQDAVNRVGVDVNTASVAILCHIAGLNKKTAQAIVDYRTAHGPFVSRDQFKQVPGIGPKTFEQCAGFLRILNAHNPLDQTGIHPEQYELTKKILTDEYGVDVATLTVPFVLEDVDYDRLVRKYGVGEETIRDIVRELANPGLDPRTEFPEQQFRSDVLSFEHVKVGMVLTGIVRNVVDFGAFVDIGLKNDALLHKSQMADRFVSNPFEIVQVGQTVTVRVLTIVPEKQHINLTMKTPEEGRLGDINVG